ncbi:hypothetical protein ABT072_28680 [Streptomyces sp. NPDC002589]|uniref:hypothetical protein n=1 Tax=Streptomyces sp. NPDC002589 TaxID=3154420 RepID=UPI00331F0970
MAAGENGHLPVATWESAVTRYAHAVREFTGRIGEAAEGERRKLAEICRQQHFVSSLALVSLDLDTARARYADRAGRWERADRKSEATLISYAHRAMLRTSPRAQFTAVAFPARAAARVAEAPVVFRRAVDVQRGAVQTLSEASAAAGVVACLRLVPLIPAGEGRLGFLRIGPDGPRMVTVSRTPQVNALVAVARFGVHRRADVVRSLARRLRCTEASAERIVESALRARLVVPALDVDEQSPRFVHDIVDSLPDGEPVREPLRRIADVAGALSSDTAGERRALLEGFGQASTQLPHADKLGLQLYEDTAVGAGVPALPAPVRRALRMLLPVLSAFDLKHDLRLALHDAVRARGPRLHLTEVAEDLADQAARAMTMPAPELADRELAACLDELRGFRHRVLADIAELLAHGAQDEVSVDEALVAAWREALPAWTDRPDASYAVMLQQATSGPAWVCNGIFGGAGATVARFLHLDAAAGGDATDRLRARLHRFLGPDVREDRACHGLNTGVHPQLLHASMTASDWADAVIEDSAVPGAPRLTTRGGHRPVVITSTRWDLLPAPSRIALWLQGGGLVQPSYDQYFREAAGTAQGPGVVRVPRISCGDLVLQRRRWYLRDLGIVAGAAEGTEESVRRLVAFAGDHRLPEDVFCKQLAEWQRGSVSMPDLTTAPPLQPKPRYLHLASPLGLKSLARDAAAFTHPFLEECLPSPREGAYTREYVYEFDRSGDPAC